ncbi:male-enhanced antigen 1-like [Zerene cesonia]|uniref:male-enhanced antigen 1-like n=1 Tax=Zerene cesonia TaxID=33412 RepID=UPI0018E5834B|nr:male-enhanced antigen 1-like [Zerene cesonia]
MVCQGPEPPDNSPQNLTPPPRHDLITNGNHDDSDDEQNDHFGYEPLPQGPEAVLNDHDSDDADSDIETSQSPAADVPQIEPMENILTREVWSSPRSTDPIQMDNERAQQVMLAMANFALPQTSIPEWAQSISEEQWKQTLNDRIEKLRGNR